MLNTIKPSYAFRFRVKTVTLVLGTKRWDGFGTVKGYSERAKAAEL